MAKLRMKDVRKMRDLISSGYPVRIVSEIFEVSETTVRNYTKFERNQLKKSNKKAIS